MKKSKMPNVGSKSGGDGGAKKMSGNSSGLKITPPGSGIRSDTKAAPSSKHPYPNGLS